MEPKILIVSTSLNPESRSQIMARYCEVLLRDQGADVRLIDIGNSSGQDDIRSAFRDATHVIFAVPIYLYDVASSAKRLVESLDKTDLEERVVGFLCAAGSSYSFMSVMPFANSLMLNFRCLIVPRFVFCLPGDFTENTLQAEIAGRIQRLCHELLAVSPIYFDRSVLQARSSTLAEKAAASDADRQTVSKRRIAKAVQHTEKAGEV